MHRRGGSDTSRVERAVRGDVVDLAARNADVIEFEVIEVGQIGAQPLACAPFLKRSPISPQEAEDATPSSWSCVPIRLRRGPCSLPGSREQCFHSAESART